MSIQYFPATQFFYVFQANEEAVIGSFTDKTTELYYMQLSCFISEVTSIGTDRMRIKIYSDANKNNLLYTSSWSDFSSITDIGSTNWRGLIRVDFNRENINSELTYYWAVQMDNYTPTATYEIGFGSAWPWPRYGTSPAASTFQDFPADVGIFGYEEVTF